MTKSFIAIALIFVTASMSCTANAADMIAAYERQPAQKQYRYVVQQQNQYAKCDEIVIEYRCPYVPHIDIVRFCDGYSPHVVARY